MNKLKQLFSNKITLTAIGLILLCLVVWMYFFIREGEKKNSMDAMRAIPADAAFVLRVDDFNKLTRKLNADGELMQAMGADAVASSLKQTMLYIADSLVAMNMVVGDLTQQPLWVSAHVFGKELAFLFSLNLPDNLYLSNVKQLVSLMEQNGYTSAELPYDDEKIVTFKHSDVEVFHASVVRRVLVISSSRVLVEMAVRQAKSPASLADNQDFIHASQAAGAHVDVNLYINQQQLPRLLPLYLSGSYQRQLNFLSRLGTFAVLDASLRTDAIHLNGFLFSNANNVSYFSALKRQKSQKLTSFDMLPRATDAALCLGITDVKSLMADYSSFHEKQQSGIARRKEKLAQLRKKLGVDPAKYFENLHPLELTLARVPISNAEEKDTWFLVLKSDKADAARKAVKDGVALMAKAENKQESDYVVNEKMGNNEPLSIYRNPAQGLISAVQGDLFGVCEDSHVIFIGDYLIFSSSPSVMKDFALSALLKKTLAQTVNLGDYTATESNMLIYLNPSKADATAFSVLSSAAQSTLKKSPLLAALPCVGLQLRMMNDKVYCNAFFKTASMVEEKQRSQGMQVDFEVKLDAPIAAEPWVVKNHNNGQKEIFVQDVNNNIYLIDNQGVILWKKGLDEQIMGAVQQIDYLKNNKLQLLFNTRTKLYLLDRLGRNVEKFPITLPSPASAPVAVFDYDRSRDYRYFIPCEDGKIRAYERNGKSLSGFSPTISFGSITRPLMHIRSQSKDYIVLADNRNTYILNRRGEERVRLRENIVPAANSMLAPELGPKGEIVRVATTTSSGDLVYIYFDGNVEHQTFKTKPGSHHFFAYFEKGGQAQYAVQDEKELRVYDSDLKSKFSQNFKYNLRVKPSMFTPLPGVTLYGVFVEDEQKAYLLNANGSVLSGFPTKAAAPLLVAGLRDKQNLYNVVACDENGFLTCYSIAK